MKKKNEMRRVCGGASDRLANGVSDSGLRLLVLNSELTRLKREVAWLRVLSSLEQAAKPKNKFSKVYVSNPTSKDGGLRREF